jgi:hypothetical protein
VERVALDEAVRDARLELQAEQRKQLRREDANDGVLKFRIRCFPEKGTAEKEKLFAKASTGRPARPSAYSTALTQKSNSLTVKNLPPAT